MGKRILTNKNNLPETLVKAVELDTHRTAGSISCTTLIDAPQIRILKRDNDYEVDVADQLYALLGTSLHHILERANISDHRRQAFMTTAETLMEKSKELAAKGSPQEQVEHLKSGANWILSMAKSLFPEIEDRFIFELTLSLPFGNSVISCTFDLYDKIEKELSDYKFCSTFSYTVPESRVKWAKQTNIYAYAVEKNLGLPVEKISIIAFFRDWSKHKYFGDNGSYPPMQIMKINVPRRSNEDIEALISYHVSQHEAADAGNIPECTGEERWAVADIFAVKQIGSVRAIKLLTSEKGADEFIEKSKHLYKKELVKEFRPGESRRCKEYCQVASVCPQYKRELANNELMSKKHPKT